MNAQVSYNKSLLTDSNYSSISGCTKNISQLRYKIRPNPIRDRLSCKMDMVQQSKGYVFEFLCRSALLLWDTEIKPKRKASDGKLQEESDESARPVENMLSIDSEKD